MKTNSLPEIAAAYAHSGLSVIPTREDKRPACTWKPYTERIMSDRELALNFRSAAGIGIVTGRVSGNLELLDFDDYGSAFDAWFNQVPKYLAARLVIERSPSGGRHVYYRVKDVVPGNRKLALNSEGKVLIETRGEGGYVKCAPSKGYELVAGELTNIQKISPLEEEMLIDAAKFLDEQGKAGSNPEAPKPSKAKSSVPSCPRDAVLKTISALDIAQMEQVLTAAGWTKVRDDAKQQHWERPGKHERSTSATFNGEVFYVFSSNAAPFEPNRGYSARSVIKLLDFNPQPSTSTPQPPSHLSSLISHLSSPLTPVDPGALPEALLHVPGFVDLLAEHTLATAPYPNRTLAFAGALTMLAHLSGRNFRDPRNLRTNLYLLALADSGVGKDYPRKVNTNLATEVGIMPTMADRFASAEGLEDALLIHPASFFQVDEVDTLFAALQEKKDSSIEKVYGALLQFATSSDTTYAMRKKAIQQTSGKACKFDKIRARGIREPHLVMLGSAIPKYLYSALSERSMENGLLSRCLILEAGVRGKAGTPHYEPFCDELLRQASHLVSLGGFEGLDLEHLDDPQPSTPNSQPSTPNPQPSTPNSQPSTPNPQPPTPNPQPSTLNRTP